METWGLQRPDHLRNWGEVTDIDEVGEVPLRDDNRQPVERQDFQPGGKFRFIVKLFIGFVEVKDQTSQPRTELETEENDIDYYEDEVGPEVENQDEFEASEADFESAIRGRDDERITQTTATGYLVKPNVLATTGHCVLGRHGHARYVKAYIGYEGRNPNTREPLMTGSVQRSWGIGIIVPAGWVDHRYRTCDVAFIRLQNSFTNINPAIIGATPDSYRDDILIVGCPRDRQGGDWMHAGTGRYVRNVSDRPYRGIVKHSVSTYNANPATGRVWGSGIAAFDEMFSAGNVGKTPASVNPAPADAPLPFDTQVRGATAA
ncbi:hypothetical protein F5X99DRAFT_412525 [Biscogniauxia marginata]|nr:hypothetical protein F5X99DRAFT_412525 [Biscogniauxia marginata]